MDFHKNTPSEQLILCSFGVFLGNVNYLTSTTNSLINNKL